jgi:hypothetical protein
MINLIGHKDPARVIKKAIFDDVSPCGKNTKFLYWRGATDTEPQGKRAKIFKDMRILEGVGIVHLCQRRNGESDYSYFAVSR